MSGQGGRAPEKSFRAAYTVGYQRRSNIVTLWMFYKLCQIHIQFDYVWANTIAIPILALVKPPL